LQRPGSAVFKPL